jgi:hypothetical protein
MALADPWQANGESILGALKELAGGQFTELAHQRRRQRIALDGLEGLGGRQLRGAAQPRDLALFTCLRLHLQHLED